MKVRVSVTVVAKKHKVTQTIRKNKHTDTQTHRHTDTQKHKKRIHYFTPFGVSCEQRVWL